MRHAATKAFHNYFDINNFTHIHTPILSPNSCEGAGEVEIANCSKKLTKLKIKLFSFDHQVIFSDALESRFIENNEKAKYTTSGSIFRQEGFPHIIGSIAFRGSM